MNNTELKTHFYKRFFGTTTKLTSSFAGFPVSLLGYISSDYSPVISTSLSMGVRVIARKTESRKITIATTSSDILKSYPIHNPYCEDDVSRLILKLKTYSLHGCDLLINSTVTSPFDERASRILGILKAILTLLNSSRINNTDLYNILCTNYDKNRILTIINEDFGYSSYIKNKTVKKLPLPLSSYKLMLINAKNQPPLFSKDKLDTLYCDIKKFYPHISSFSDIDKDMLIRINSIVKSPQKMYLISHLISECERIKTATRTLNSCNIKEFSKIVKDSYISQKSVLKSTDKNIFICDNLYTLDGVLCARITDDGVIAIVSDSACSLIAKGISFDFEHQFGYPPVISINNTASD